MRKALFVLVLIALALPTTVLANESKLQGGWNLVAVAYAGQRVDMPPEMNIHVAFDRVKKTWTLKTDYSDPPTEVSGPYRLEGDQLYVSFQGQTAPPLTVAFVKDELHVTLAIGDKPNAEPYVFIAKRGQFKPRPKQPQPKPAPPPSQ